MAPKPWPSSPTPGTFGPHASRGLLVGWSADPVPVTTCVSGLFTLPPRLVFYYCRGLEQPNFYHNPPLGLLEMSPFGKTLVTIRQGFSNTPSAANTGVRWSRPVIRSTLAT